jgi:hypothetical protein
MIAPDGRAERSWDARSYGNGGSPSPPSKAWPAFTDGQGRVSGVSQRRVACKR